MSRTKLTSLTADQTAAMAVCRDEWIATGLSCEPVDRVRATAAVNMAYQCAGLAPPRVIVFLASPLAGAYAAAQVAADKPILGEELKRAAQQQIRSPIWGAHSAGWISYYAYFREKIGLGGIEKIDGLIALARECGWLWVFDDIAIITDRHRILRRDSQGRLHCQDGPAVQYSDGFSVYSVHGVRVPEYVVMTPEKITCGDIDKEANAEVRRIKIERYGLARYLLDTHAETVHEDRFGKLYRKNLKNSDPLLMVFVKNSTPEPDGTFKEYQLCVHHELRPLPRPHNGNILGEPQELTAHNAVASTFGLRGENYAPVEES